MEAVVRYRRGILFQDRMYMFYLQAFLEGNLEEAALGLGQVGFE